jgi:hypothetical protein
VEEKEVSDVEKNSSPSVATLKMKGKDDYKFYPEEMTFA